MEPGQVIEGYRLHRVLGRGSRAVVWQATAEASGTLVALKLLDNADDTAAERLRREYDVQRRIQHDNVVAVYDLLEIEGRLTLVQELVEGSDLRTWIEERRPDRTEALRLFAGILRGLDAAHAQGVVHRDLKPGNILVAPSRRPTPKIADFGVVKVSDGVNLTRSGMVLGTFRYMAPEQLQNAAAVDARADLFSAGCILYELLTGNRAFDAPNKVALMNVVRLKQHQPIPEDLDPAVASVLDALLSPDPDGRPDSAAAVLEALGLPWEVDTTDADVSAPRKGTGSPLALWIGVGAVGFVAVAALLWVGLH